MWTSPGRLLGDWTSGHWNCGLPCRSFCVFLKCLYDLNHWFWSWRSDVNHETRRPTFSTALCEHLLRILQNIFYIELFYIVICILWINRSTCLSGQLEIPDCNSRFLTSRIGFPVSGGKLLLYTFLGEGSADCWLLSLLFAQNFYFGCCHTEPHNGAPPLSWAP